MLDFKELPVDGTRFEQLIREMLLRSGFEVHWTGVGADGGRDLVATETVDGKLRPFSRKWLVSCKHKAHGGGSVVMADVPSIIDDCVAVGAEGFLLACSTQPASSVVKRLEEIQTAGALQTLFWDAIEIERRLDVPALFPLMHQFLPASAKARPWRIHNTESPSFWAANFRDYFIYLGCRIANAFPDLDEVTFIADRLESIALPGDGFSKHYLRLRAVYFDDKHEQFSVFADYLYPSGDSGNVLTPEALNKVLRNGMGLHSDATGMWFLTHWDIRYQAIHPYSDRFHCDAKQYYEPFMSNYRIGHARDGWIDEIEGPDEEPALSLR
jgi:hypothetical protein